MRTVSLVLVSLLSVLDSRPQEPQRAVQGAVVRPAVALTGNSSAVAQGGYHRARTAQELARLWLQHRGLEAPKGEYGFFYNRAGVPEVDFAAFEVVVLFGGECINSAGFRIETVDDEPGRRVVRFDHKSFQTAGPDGGGKQSTPFGFFVLAKTALPLVLQENVQSEIGQPPEWKERARL